MRQWLASCIARLATQPPSARRNQLLSTLQQSLERYGEPQPPQLRIVKGGRD
jgi:hypothetical protein